MPHIIWSWAFFLGLFSRDEQVVLGPVHETSLGLSEHSLVDLNDLFRYRRGVQMTNVLPPIGSFAMRQNLIYPSSKFRHARFRDVTSRRLPNDLANIADIRGDNGKVASHGLLDDVG